MKLSLYAIRYTSFCRLLSFVYRLYSTLVEDSLQISYFLFKTNPILSAVGGLQMNLNNSNKMSYKKTNLALSEVEWANSNPNKPNSKPALSLVEWVNPELSEALSAFILSFVEVAEGAVEKFLSLCPESVTIIRKSVIRQLKRARLDWLLLGTIIKIILEHSPVGAVLYLEVLTSTWR